MKKLLVAVCAVLMASPAFAAVQNVKVSGNIDSTWIGRSNFNLGITNKQEYVATGGAAGNLYIAGSPLGEPTDALGGYIPLGLKRQNVFITQVRVNIDADLTDNVSTQVGLLNERAWNAENNNTTDIAKAANGGYGDTNVKLYLASLTLRQFLYSPLTVTIGRQYFGYGNNLVIGYDGVNNQTAANLKFIAQDFTYGTTYDGIKAVLDYKPLTIDLIYFKNSQALLNGNALSGKSSSDVYGINANYQLGDSFNTVLETYMFSRINGSDVTGTTASNRGDTLFVPGLRASTNPVKGLNVQAEVAWQLGNHPVVTTQAGCPGSGCQEAEKREAMAAQFLASYSLPVCEKYKPSVNASYTYVSGDRNGLANFGSSPNTKSAKYYTAWDPFNESQGGGTIYNTLFPLTNLHIAALGASVQPIQDVTAAVTWSGLWAAAYYTPANPLALFQPDGGTTVIYPVTKQNTRGLGNETDINLTYNYTEDVTFGLNLGWFVPGSVFSSNNKNTASQALASVGVKF